MAKRDTQKFVIAKMAAAKRQLKTAIRLWFYDGDPVSVHTLVYASYEIISDICEHRGIHGNHMLYDSPLVKDEYKGMWNKMMREHGNFFKHADKDPNATIEFSMVLTEMFLTVAVMALQESGEELAVEEGAYLLWIALHYPETMTPEFQAMLDERVAVKDIQVLRKAQKSEFFENYQQVQIILGRTRM